MINVEKKDDCILVTIKVEKRVLSGEPKKFFYTKDALEEAKKHFPDTKFEEKSKQEFVVSNCKKVQEATWIFPLIKEEKKQLKTPEKRAKVAKDIAVEISTSAVVDKKTE